MFAPIMNRTALDGNIAMAARHDRGAAWRLNHRGHSPP
jgi:hypothetical protein